MRREECAILDKVDGSKAQDRSSAKSVENPLKAILRPQGQFGSGLFDSGQIGEAGGVERFSSPS